MNQTLQQYESDFRDESRLSGECIPNQDQWESLQRPPMPEMPPDPSRSGSTVLFFALT